MNNHLAASNGKKHSREEPSGWLLPGPITDHDEIGRWADSRAAVPVEVCLQSSSVALQN